jgi:general secretion pathway protein M
MRNWWTGLSRREQALLGMLAVLFLALIAWYGVWRPVIQFQRAAAAGHERAVREQQSVELLLARIKAAASATQSRQNRPLAEAVRQSLEAAGIAAARFEPDSGGGLRVAVGAVPAGLLFPWIAELQTRHGVTPRHFVVVKAGQGLLELDATFVREGE